LKDHEFLPKPLLTKREQEVFDLLVQDKTTKEIAQELFISEKTVRNHISNVVWFEKRINRGEWKPTTARVVGFDDSERNADEKFNLVSVADNN
jgi:LuxR family transcriptional regulator of spore coat protein